MPTKKIQTSRILYLNFKKLQSRLHAVQNHADLSEVDQEGDDEGIVQLAVTSQNRKILQHVIEKHADVNFVLRNGTSALATAVKQGNVKMVRLLLKAGAYINEYNDHLETPLTLAVTKNRLDMVKLILQYLPDVNKFECDKQSALHKADTLKHPLILYELRHYNTNLQNKLNSTVSNSLAKIGINLMPIAQMHVIAPMEQEELVIKFETSMKYHNEPDEMIFLFVSNLEKRDGQVQPCFTGDTQVSNVFLNEGRESNICPFAPEFCRNFFSLDHLRTGLNYLQIFTLKNPDVQKRLAVCAYKITAVSNLR